MAYTSSSSGSGGEARPRARTLRVPGFTLMLGQHPPRSSLPRHAHDDPSMCFVLRGGFTEYSGGDAAECGPDTFKVMPAGEPHWNRFGSDETRGLRIDVDRSRFVDVPAIHRALDERHRLAGGGAGGIARRLAAELTTADETTPVAVEALALELMVALARGAGPERRAGAPRWLLGAEELIRARYPTRLTVAEIARAVQVHPATLSRGYRDRFGCTIGERIRALRVEQAARELMETSRPLSDIALDAGFYDQSHFTNVFRRRLGVTPGAYRARVASGAAPPDG
jgi:AraC family transcriptional regulator